MLAGLAGARATAWSAGGRASALIGWGQDARKVRGCWASAGQAGRLGAGCAAEAARATAQWAGPVHALRAGLGWRLRCVCAGFGLGMADQGSSQMAADRSGPPGFSRAKKPVYT